MTTYYDISNATTTQKAVKAGYGILCNNTTILCNSEEYYCDGSVVFRDIGYGRSGRVLFGDSEPLWQTGGVIWGSAGGTTYNKVSYD